MKKLWIYLKDYKKETILAPLFKMLEASFELFVPLVVASMIDIGIAARDMSYIVKMSIIMALLGVIGLLCSVTAQYFSAKAAVGFAGQVRQALFSHIQSLSFSEIDTIGTSTLITRMTSDVNQVQSGVNMVLRLFLRSPFIVFGAMIMAFTIDVKAALIFVVTIPLLSLVVFGIMVLSIPLYRKVQECLDKVVLMIRENLSGVRVIRAFCREETEKKTFQEKNIVLTQIQNFVGKITAVMNPVTYVMINAALILLLYTGAIRVDAGVLKQGQVIALVNYMSQILVELIKLANLIITVTKAAACANRIEHILELENSQKTDVEQGISELEKAENAIEFQDVSFTYQNAKEHSLKHISFQAKAGETIGIIGGTGSGKTTLVHLIPRFYDATQGRILFYGKDIKSYSLSFVRKCVGIVLQKAVLFAGSIQENLRWGKEDASEQEMWEALATAQAVEVVKGKGAGLQEAVSQGGKNFSGGQKQRLTIARALMRKPKILILDDSASALDYATDAALRKSIRQLEEEPVVFIVSQRTASIQNADKILVLEDGVMVGMGTHENLLETCEVYREIYASQQS